MGALISLAIAYGVVAEIVWGETGGTNGRPSGDPAMARVMCEDFVKDRLVSPSSADFSRPEVRNAGGTDYWVTGSVDADNRMGATIRIDYECTVRDEGDSWLLVNMEHRER